MKPVKKYVKGGKVDPPKKRKKGFTNYKEFQGRQSAYQDSLYAANTSEATVAYLDEALKDYEKVPTGNIGNWQSDRVSYADIKDNTNIVGKPYDLNVTATKDNFVFPSTYDRLFVDDQVKINTTSRPLSYQNYQLKNPQTPIDQYTYQPPGIVLSDIKYSVDPNDDRIYRNNYADDKRNPGRYINYEKNPNWRYNHKYRLADNLYEMNRWFTIDKFQQPNVEPVYTGEPVLKTSKVEEAYQAYKSKVTNPPPVNQKQSMVSLPSKTPSLNLKPPPPMVPRNPLPIVYSRRLNQQSQEYVYDTSKGEIRKKVGKEDAAFYSSIRPQMEEMRANRK